MKSFIASEMYETTGLRWVKSLGYEVYVLSHFSRVQLFATLWTAAHQAPLPMGVSRQESWSGLPFPSPGHLPNPGTEPVSPAPSALAGEFFTAESLERPRSKCTYSEMGFVN